MIISEHTSFTPGLGRAGGDFASTARTATKSTQVPIGPDHSTKLYCDSIRFADKELRYSL